MTDQQINRAETLIQQGITPQTLLTKYGGWHGLYAAYFTNEMWPNDDIIVFEYTTIDANLLKRLREEAAA
jgi:hypothetical protein